MIVKIPLEPLHREPIPIIEMFMLSVITFRSTASLTSENAASTTPCSQRDDVASPRETASFAAASTQLSAAPADLLLLQCQRQVLLLIELASAKGILLPKAITVINGFLAGKSNRCQRAAIPSGVSFQCMHTQVRHRLYSPASADNYGFPESHMLGDLALLRDTFPRLCR